jgi:hypothetical protein
MTRLGATDPGPPATGLRRWGGVPCFRTWESTILKKGILCQKELREGKKCQGTTPVVPHAALNGTGLQPLQGSQLGSTTGCPRSVFSDLGKHEPQKGLLCQTGMNREGNKCQGTTPVVPHAALNGTGLQLLRNAPYCPHASTASSSSHARLIACQYHAVVSIAICRYSTRRNHPSAHRQTISPPTPRIRCVACSPVMM